jgi:hypothetical protein
MKPPIDPDLLPILTETADGTMLDLPTLTEMLEDRLETAAPALPLTDEQCRRLAEQLFPQLEATLRSAIGFRSETRWAAAMQQVQAMLPELIRNATAHP